MPGPATIRLRVNGEQREVAAGSSVEDLVRGLGHDSRAVAVERNGSILRRADYAATPLAAGDRIEIVRFVQGGRGVYNLPGVGR